jgi:lipopolysaccharide transport system ATP-binding protein
MSSNDIAIRVSNLSKRYEIYDAPRDRLKQFVLPRLRRLAGKNNKQYFREFWALKEVSFEIKKGETIGIIGRNGAGKSTLLQILCSTLAPTGGSVEIRGRVAALLELGAGFNSEFTGRENVYMNASVLGLSKEDIDARFDDIVTFADIGDFIEQPVKTYSSGMYVRLAFAVIAHVNADILIIDEALAVGDVFFQQKCMRFLRTVQNNGGTVVFVSHDTAAVISLCDKAILLSRDANAVLGKTSEICRKYIEDIYAERIPTETVVQTETIDSLIDQSINRITGESKGVFEGGAQPENLIRITPFRHDADSFGHGGIKIEDVWFEDDSGSRMTSAHGGEPINFCIKAESYQNILWPVFGFMIKDRLGQYIIAEGTDLAFRQHAIKLNKGNTAQVKFSFLMPILFQGEYSVNVAVAEGMGDDHIQHHWVNDAMVLHSLNCRLVHGICGLQNMSMEIQISTESTD